MSCNSFAASGSKRRKSIFNTKEFGIQEEKDCEEKAREIEERGYHCAQAAQEYEMLTQKKEHNCLRKIESLKQKGSYADRCKAKDPGA
ncbi:hypothetical protein GCM10020331_063450 [Ectobacillus funiculus]